MRTHIDDFALSIDSVSNDIAALADNLDHRHRQQRKLQFLLDIRGHLAMNRPKGDYVEFGLYRGEMMYGAHYVLDHLGLIQRYIGFDSFAGEPTMTPSEEARLPFIRSGDYKADEAETRSFLGRVIGEERLKLVVGDFRVTDQRRGEPANPVVVGVVDCNLESSIEAALSSLLPHIVTGGVLFLDDYFLNLTPVGPWHEQLLETMSERFGRRLIEFKTYPPCARAFLVFDKSI